MPMPSIQEQAVHGYWADNYNPVTDLEGWGNGVWVDPDGGEHFSQIVEMDDGTWWWDTDRDGWFDFGTTDPRRGDVHYFDGYDWYEMDVGGPGGGGGGHPERVANPVKTGPTLSGKWTERGGVEEPEQAPSLQGLAGFELQSGEGWLW